MLSHYLNNDTYASLHGPHHDIRKGFMNSLILMSCYGKMKLMIVIRNVDSPLDMHV